MAGRTRTVKAAESTESGGMPAFGEANPKVQQIDLVGSAVPGKAETKPRGARRSSTSSKGAGKSVKDMTDESASSMVAAVFACYGMFVARNPGYLLTKEDIANNGELWTEIARQINGLPDWMRVALTVGGGSSFIAMGLVSLGQQKIADAAALAAHFEAQQRAAAS